MSEQQAAPYPFPAVWACAWGEDLLGYWQVFEVTGVRQVVRWIPPGQFMMGSPSDEPERKDNEVQHLVTLTRGFWLADTACSQALWQAVMGDNPSHFQDDPHNPVEQVSWDDVQQCLQRLNRLVPELAAGLPTEAQWEYACRAGTTTPFWWGDQITTDQANYDGSAYAGGKQGKGRGKTMPVCSFAPNPWGLYQMHGNVDEWCQDRWQEGYDIAQTVDPIVPVIGHMRVLRGGSWSVLAGGLRSAYRLGSGPGVRSRDLGFRMAPGQAARTG
jgi:formylglycine-generating enzyme required for sulfatase activity